MLQDEIYLRVYQQFQLAKQSEIRPIPTAVTEPDLTLSRLSDPLHVAETPGDPGSGKAAQEISVPLWKGGTIMCCTKFTCRTSRSQFTTPQLTSIKRCLALFFHLRAQLTNYSKTEALPLLFCTHSSRAPYKLRLTYYAHLLPSVLLIQRY